MKKKKKMKFSTKVVLYRMVLIALLAGIWLASSLWIDSLGLQGAYRFAANLFGVIIFIGGYVLMNMFMDIYVKIMQDKDDEDKS